MALDPTDRETYEWQIWTAGFGEAGQEKLKNASVLISRVGGVGGVVAYELAAAGVGKLVLAHAGNLRPSDLNRQILMSHAALGTPRVECAEKKLREFNPRLKIEAVPENISEENAARLIGAVDVVVDCAPLFQERLAMNREAVRQKKPLIECSMFDMEAQLMTIVPGKTPCLACLYPEPPPAWKRQFPVFGAVAGMIGSLGALEAIKLISGVAQPLDSQVLMCDLKSMSFRKMSLQKNPNCPVCGGK
jgi:molybdopterin/thiamine biosynthesis adenylyltransferase